MQQDYTSFCKLLQVLCNTFILFYFTCAWPKHGCGLICHKYLLLLLALIVQLVYLVNFWPVLRTSSSVCGDLAATLVKKVSKFPENCMKFPKCVQSWKHCYCMSATHNHSASAHFARRWVWTPHHGLFPTNSSGACLPAFQGI